MSHLQVVLNKLKANKDINAFQVEETKLNRYELYYVLDKLETSRVVNYNTIATSIYVDFEEDNVLYRGSSEFNLDENITSNEMDNKITTAIKRAKYVKNKFFDLPKKDDFSYNNDSIVFNSELTLKDIAFNIADAIFKANVYKDGWINSTEIFVSRSDYHFINSYDCDYSYPKYHIMLEVIPTWSGEKEEVELYYSHYSNDVDYEYITSEVNEILLQAKYRASALKLADVADITEADVILDKENVREFLTFFTSNMVYATQYRKMSRYSVGDVLQNEDSEFDVFDMTMVANIKGSSTSSPIDYYGTVLKPVKIIDNGKFINTYGDCKNGYYMGIKNPTGNLKNTVVRPGKKSFDEMKTKPYLQALNFSAFQLDDSSGYYGGEVRLGLYFDGTKVIPVTGFSVSGNIYNDKDKVYLSKDEISLSRYHGPKYLQVKMTVIK